MTKTLAARVAELASTAPDAPAYLFGGEAVSWREYHARAARLATVLRSLGLAPGERVAVWLPDGPGVHAAFLAAEQAGLVCMGIGARAGPQEVEHLLRRSGASVLVCRPLEAEDPVAALLRSPGGGDGPVRHQVEVEGELALDEPIRVDGGRVESAATVEPSAAEPVIGVDDVFLLNSTSGTTGLPKVVVHDQRRWLAFHEFAVAAGELGPSDVFMSVVPAPFGFGIWTAHVTPTLLGVPTALLGKFSPDAALAEIERWRVTVLAAVTTQFVMMLSSPELERRDLSSLRILFTGGEPIPYARAADFEDRTGATVLQFYGSNETGAVSRTCLHDPRERRLRGAGRVIPEMNVRLFDAAGLDVTASGRGQPGCKGPTLSRGYWDDGEANAALVRPDGWMLLGDIVELDSEGWLEVVGRTDDFIIRGGLNISGPGVEEAVASHPAVALVAAVGMPDPVFGERVCVYVELAPGATLELGELTAHLSERGVSKSTWPERLVVLDELPRGSGGKLAKQQLRDAAVRLAASESAAADRPERASD